MTLSGKERAVLRADANRLDATVHVGQHGISPALLRSLDDALRTHELVKVHLGQPLDLAVEDAARHLAGATGAVVIQVIGKTTTLYRQNPAIERKPGSQAPWGK